LGYINYRPYWPLLVGRHVRKKSGQFTNIPGRRRVIGKEQLKNVGRPEIELPNTEFKELKEKHDCKKRKEMN
jgi:hypothetical protein